MPVGRPRQPLPPHGTRERYQHRTDPCRCGKCRGANAGYQAVYRASAAPPPPVVTRARWEQLELPPGSYEQVRFRG